MSRRPVLASVVTVIMLSGGGRSARAYDFEVRALTLGQVDALRLFRPIRGDATLRRRRFTQTLSLDIWNIGTPADRWRARSGRGHRRHARYFVTAYARVDHDFGELTRGSITIGDRRFAASDLIPELHATNLNLDVLYAYGGARGLGGGTVDVELGRQLLVDSLRWWSFDGALVRVRTPWSVVVEGVAGARVRDVSPAGSSVQELDGTPDAECVEYVEGPVPGSGAWRPIDRPVPRGRRSFESEFDVCPQRRQWMPTVGVALATAGAPVDARIVYRRSSSRTPGLLGDVDRLTYPDTGLYPNETGDAPRWAVNEEHVTATLGTTRRWDHGRSQLAPFAAVRYSMLHGLVDEAHAGARLRLGAHAVVAEYYYLFPTFDGDSIFNVFSTAPYHDGRLSYQLAPAGTAWSGTARGWVRWYGHEDEPDDGSIAAYSGGGQVSARYRPGTRGSLRMNVFAEGGFGGARVGGAGRARWRVNDELELRARMSVVRFEADALARLHGTTVGGRVGATYQLEDGIAVRLMVEDYTSRLYTSQVRAIASLDLAFAPEH